MKIFTVMIPFSDCGEISKCDAIEYEGGLWLVPMWLDNQTTRERKPLRIIRVDKLDLTPNPQNSPFGDFLAPAMTIPKSLLEGRSQPEEPIVVVESPNISFPLSKQNFH